MWDDFLLADICGTSHNFGPSPLYLEILDFVIVTAEPVLVESKHSYSYIPDID